MSTEPEEIRVLGENDGAKPHTMEGWVSATGHFYKHERDARYDGATHKRCACGELTEKYYTLCGACRNKSKRLAWEAAEGRDWGGTTPVFCLYYDRYFQDIDELEEAIADDDIDPKSLMLAHCAYEKVPYLGIEFYEDLFDEEGDMCLSKELCEAMHQVNLIARKELDKTRYYPTKVRANYSYSSKVLA